VVAAGGELRPAYLLDVAFSLEPGVRPIEGSTRLHVHHGTREAPARLVPLADGYAQLRLEAPLMAVAGDRVILRQVAPPDTIGGGVVADATPRKHGPSPEVVAALRGEAGSEPERPAEPEPGPGPEPLDDSALALLALLRSDGASPRADVELAAAAGL